MNQNAVDLEAKVEEKPIALEERVMNGVRNYAIDTSAKIVCFAPLMGAMETYNGLEWKEVLKARAVSALIDGVVARAYTKTADYCGEKTKPITPIISRTAIKGINSLRETFGKENLDLRQKKIVYNMVESMRNYAVDTASMIGVYSPAYAGVLKVAGADAKQIGYSLLMGAGIAALTSRPFRKYILRPWRKLCGFKE